MKETKEVYCDIQINNNLWIVLDESRFERNIQFSEEQEERYSRNGLNVDSFSTEDGLFWLFYISNTNGKTIQVIYKDENEYIKEPSVFRILEEQLDNETRGKVLSILTKESF